MSDTPPKTQDDIPYEVFLKLDLIKALRDARETPFDELLREVYRLQNKYIFKNKNPPTRVLVGSKQYAAFHYAPPCGIKDDQFMTGLFKLDGMEVIRVLKDDFLEVI